MWSWIRRIHNRQEEYYRAINDSNEAGESTAFLEFMLSAIKEALQEATESAGEISKE